MREILFRGRRIDNGEWIYGYYTGPVGIINDHAICDINSVSGQILDVDPATVGQYTGLKDRNGVRIFEGDVVEFDKGQFVVEYFESRMGFGFSGLKGRGVVCGFTMTDWEHLKVIGNVHDKPELLEV